MGQINIYKIDNNKEQEFYQAMYSKLTLIDTIELNKNINQNKICFGMALYISHPTEERDINWNWLLKEFNVKEIKIHSNPKSVLLVEKDNNIYVVTFGASYFIVDKYCDRNFAFKFARKVDYKEIKTTALTAPNSQRNKIINTYINYNNLEFDSGESFTKIKVKLKIDDEFPIYKETIEIGNSIKFTLNEDSLDNIANLILHIENILENEEDKYKIPVFAKVLDNNLIDILDNRLKEEVINNIDNINISEIDIIGATEIFNYNDTSFSVRFEKKSAKKISELSINEFKKYAKEKGFNLNENILDLKITMYKDEVSIRTEKLKNLIDYTDDINRCILIKGQWYYFNDDYLSYLADSIKEIDAIYNPEYDFYEYKYNEFLDRKYNEEKHKYDGKDEKYIRYKIEKIYYKEKYYNIMLSESYGFKNYDRKLSKIDNANVELMDLYKDKTIFAVKMGSSSAKLCYTVDQLLQTIKIYKHNLDKNKLPVKDVALLFVLEKSRKLNLIDNKPDINELNMLVLKNKLDYWKKEVRVLGYNPVIYINYLIK